MASRARKSTSSVPSSSRQQDVPRRRRPAEYPDVAFVNEYEADYLDHEPRSEEEIRPPSSAASNAAGSSTAAPSSSKPPRVRTSPVWNIFERYDEEYIDPQTGLVGIKKMAKCKLCTNPNKSVIYDITRGGGTGTLTKHITKFHPDGETTGRIRQTTLNPTTGGIFSYNHTRTRKAMAKFVPSLNLSFGFAETPEFTEFCRESLNPAYRPIPRSTLRYDIMQEYQNHLSILRCILASFPGRVCLTSDMWESSNGLHILCITCHWIDSDWIMQKRIISFRLVEDRATTLNITNQMIDIVRFFEIEGKILTVTFDNASNMTGAARQLFIELQNPYNRGIFHNRCICHILNLTVKAGFRHIEEAVHNIRYVFTYIKQNKERRDYFRHTCQAYGDRAPNKIKTDNNTRWNSTFYMLKYALKYKDAINRFNSEKTHVFISNADWGKIEKLCLFLEFFEYLTKLFSGCYYPTSQCVLPKLLDLLIHLDSFKYDHEFQSVYEDMLAKIKKYFHPLPDCICIAYVLDPRYKMSRLRFAISELYTSYFGDTNENAEAKFHSVSDLIRSLYDHHYLELHSTMSSAVAPPPPPTVKRGKKGGYWEKLFKDKFSSSQRQQLTGSADELSYYFNNALETRYEDEIDILAWWKEKSSTYPVLSIMAKDLLTIPTSSVASESAFSQGKQQLTPQRSSMIGTTLEVLVCLKDWRDAERRTQGLTGMFDETEEDLIATLSLTSENSEDEPAYVPDDDGSEDHFYD